MIAVIVLSSFTSFLLCLGIATLLYFKFRACSVQDDQIPQSLVSFPAKPSGKLISIQLKGALLLLIYSVYVFTNLVFTLICAVKDTWFQVL